MSDENVFSKPNLEIQISDNIGELIGALAEAQKTFTPVDKNKEGQPFAGKPYLYADWAEILKMALPKLNAQGLVLVQNTFPCVEDGNLYVQSAIYHKSGQFMKSFFPVCSLRSTKQQDIGSSLTYAKRYGGSALLGISTEEDTDAQGSDVKTEEAVKVVSNKARTAVTEKHDPETGEVESPSTVARDLFNRITSPDLSAHDVVGIRKEIDDNVNDKKIVVAQSTPLRKTLGFRERLFQAKVTANIEALRSDLANLPNDEGYIRKAIEGLVDAKGVILDAEATATALKA